MTVLCRPPTGRTGARESVLPILSTTKRSFVPGSDLSTRKATLPTAVWSSGHRRSRTDTSASTRPARSTMESLPLSACRASFPPFTGTLPNLDAGIGVGSTAEWVNPDGARAPRTANWNLNIQRELFGGFVADIAYVGVRGTSWPSNLLNLNQVPTSLLSLGALLRKPFNDPEAVGAGVRSPYPGFSGSVAQALRPFPQYNAIAVKAHPVGNSTYHSLQVKGEKRFAKGLGFLVTYTMSKNISDINANAWAIQDPNPMDAERGLPREIDLSDRPHATPWWPTGSTSCRSASKPLASLESSFAGGNWAPRYTTRAVRRCGFLEAPPLPLFNGGNRPNRVSGADTGAPASARATWTRPVTCSSTSMPSRNRLRLRSGMSDALSPTSAAFPSSARTFRSRSAPSSRRSVKRSTSSSGLSSSTCSTRLCLTTSPRA